MDSEIKQMCQQKLTTVMLGSELINSSGVTIQFWFSLGKDWDRAQEFVLAER
jgi:hypothetical protein